MTPEENADTEIIMRFIITSEVVKQAIDVLRTVNSGKDTKVVLELGTSDMGNVVGCGVRLTTAAEQVEFQFPATKPEDWDGKTIKTPVDATKFIQVVESVLSFNEDIYIDIVGTILEVGILGKVKTSLPIESQIPEKINPLPFFFNYQIAGTELTALLRRGCSFTEETVDPRGLHNATLKLFPKENKITGFSSDGHSLARANVKAAFAAKGSNEKLNAHIEQMEKNVAEYCAQHTEQSADAYNVVIPREAVNHLLSLSEGQKGVKVFVDSRFMHVQIGQTLMYPIKQAGSNTVPLETVEAFVKNGADAKVVVDSATLLRTVDFVNKNNAIVGSQTPLKMGVSEGNTLIATSGLEDMIESAIQTISIEGNGFIALNGEKLKTVVGSLNKGNLTMCACKQYVYFYNGDNTDASFALLFQINLEQNQADDEEDEAEESAE